jgi:hypothetical protein
MTDEVERIWKEVALAYVTILVSAWRTEKGKLKKLFKINCFPKGISQLKLD